MRGSKLFLTLIVSVVPGIYSAQSSHEAIPGNVGSSKDSHEAGLFIERINHALIKRFGFEVFDVKYGMPIKSLTLEDDSHEGFKVFSPDGKHIVTFLVGLAQTTTRLRDIATGQLQAAFEEESFQGFSPSGKLLILEAYNQTADQKETKIRNAVTGELLRIYAGESDLRFSSDGSGLVSKVLKPAYAPSDLRLRDAKTGTIIKTIQEEIFKGFSPDGNTFVTELPSSPFDEENLILRNAKTGELLASFEKEIFVGFSSKGNILLTEMVSLTPFETHTMLRNSATGELLCRIDNEHTEGISSTGIVASQKEVFNDNIGLRRDLILRDEHDSALFEGERFISFSPDGSVLVSESLQAGQPSLNLRNTVTGILIEEKLNENFVAFSPDSRILACRKHIEMRNDLHLRSALTGELIRRLEGSKFEGFSSEGAILATRKDAKIVLHQPNFRADLAVIKDLFQRILLLKAAQNWLNGKPYTVEAHNVAYRSLIKKLKYLNNPLLFDVVTSPQSIYEDVRKALDAYSKEVRDPLHDATLKDLTLRTYDAWYDLHKSQGLQSSNADIFEAFMSTLPPRSPAWLALRQHADELANNYPADREAREAQRMPQVPPASMSELAASAASSASSSTNAASSSSEIRVPDAPRTMQLFEGAAPDQL